MLVDYARTISNKIRRGRLAQGRLRYCVLPCMLELLHFIRPYRDRSPLVLVLALAQFLPEAPGATPEPRS
jgi:hypothetical protein